MHDILELLPSVVAIAREAGAAVMDVYTSDDLGTTYKADSSPVTQADIQSNNLIIAELQKLTPDIPIISEESLDAVPDADRLAADTIWLVDPLDGTKGFIAHNGEFTVNIALISHGEPVLGVVFAPASNKLYYAAGGKAWRQQDNREPEQIHVNTTARTPIVVVSRSHLDPATTAWLEQLGEHQQTAVDSSLKLCYVATGEADYYPRLGPIMEWDTAAADAIVRQAGGHVLTYPQREPVTYNKPDMHQPAFVVSGDVS